MLHVGALRAHVLRIPFPPLYLAYNTYYKSLHHGCKMTISTVYITDRNIYLLYNRIRIVLMLRQILKFNNPERTDFVWIRFYLK